MIQAKHKQHQNTYQRFVYILRIETDRPKINSEKFVYVCVCVCRLDSTVFSCINLFQCPTQGTVKGKTGNSTDIADKIDLTDARKIQTKMPRTRHNILNLMCSCEMNGTFYERHEDRANKKKRSNNKKTKKSIFQKPSECTPLIPSHSVCVCRIAQFIS